MTQPALSPSSDPQLRSDLLPREEKNATTHHDYTTALPPSMRFRGNPDDILPSIQEALSSDALLSPAESRGLSSLVEAALAPPIDNGLPVSESYNPNIWNSSMFYNDTSSICMGSYDADISWTLDCFSQDSWSNMELDLDIGLGGTSLLQPDTSGQSNDLDAEGDEEDWPDKVSKLESPLHWGPKVTPRLVPESWHTVAQESRASSLTTGPRQQINDMLRSTMLGMLQIGLPAQSSDTVYVEINTATFPPSEVLDYFLRLYFRHVHPRFPITHVPTFNIFASSPLLLLSMMFLGSCYSMADRGRFLRLFHNRGRVASMRLHEIEEKHVSPPSRLVTHQLMPL